MKTSPGLGVLRGSHKIVVCGSGARGLERLVLCPSGIPEAHRALPPAAGLRLWDLVHLLAQLHRSRGTNEAKGGGFGGDLGGVRGVRGSVLDGDVVCLAR